MRKNFNCVAPTPKPGLREALEAIRAHSDARSGMAPSEEIERLQHLADRLYYIVLETYSSTAKIRAELHEGPGELRLSRP